jgi:hypothetical protein
LLVRTNFRECSEQEEADALTYAADHQDLTTAIAINLIESV